MAYDSLERTGDEPLPETDAVFLASLAAPLPARSATPAAPPASSPQDGVDASTVKSAVDASLRWQISETLDLAVDATVARHEYDDRINLLGSSGDGCQLKLWIDLPADPLHFTRVEQ